LDKSSRRAGRIMLPPGGFSGTQLAFRHYQSATDCCALSSLVRLVLGFAWNAAESAWTCRPMLVVRCRLTAKVLLYSTVLHTRVLRIFRVRWDGRRPICKPLARPANAVSLTQVTWCCPDSQPQPSSVSTLALSPSRFLK
jgi:hypothetical protein